MIRYVPDFIFNRFHLGEFCGSLCGYALLFDIADFTPISTEFQKHGKVGAEELSKFLDFVFGEPIAIIQRYGGFISLFAGDAFCAIFPESIPESILSAATSIRSYIQDQSTYQTAIGSFALKVRQTVVFGDIHWQIFENELQNEYVFYGEAMAELAELSSAKEDLLFSPKAALQIGEKHFQKLEQGYQLLSLDFGTESQLLEYQYPPDCKASFINPNYLEDNPQSEIRSGAYCFANLEAISFDERGKAIGTIQKLADKYGGLVNKYDATDKGLVGIILFGIPRSEGNTLQRICDFSLEAIDKEPKLALGIGCGNVFAGFTGSGETREYTALGHPLNLAARLMSKARAGEILADTYLWQELHKDYLFNYLGMLNLKGVSLPIRYYILNRRIENQASFQENRFVGREDEIGQIKDTIQHSMAENKNSILYVSGDPGIGKSRLVKEAISDFTIGAVHYFRTSCDAIIKTPFGIFKQIIRSHFFLNASIPKEAGIAMFRALWPGLAAGDTELIRIESILASLIGYEWEASIWSMLPQQEKPDQLRKAIIRFVHQLAKTKPILIHLDDGQWLDDDSKAILQELSAKEISPVVIVSACRYLDDGNKVDLGLSKHQRTDIELGNLCDKGCMELIQSILRLSIVPDETLRLITDRSMGNPLFVEQLSSYLQENGIIDDKGKITGEVGYLSSFSISDIVGSRIDRLSEKIRECMFNASVLGMEFNAKVLSQMLNSEASEELQAGISNRIWKDLDELRYIFTHILIKDIVYQRMMSGKLQILHQTAAEAMEIVFVDNLDEHAEEIALHYRNAQLIDKAIHYYELASQFHRSNWHLDKAEHHIRNAVDLAQSFSGDDSLQTIQLKIEASKVLNLRGMHRNAIESYHAILKQMISMYGEKDYKLRLVVEPLVDVLNSAAKYKEAITHAENLVQIISDKFGNNDPEVYKSLTSLGLVHHCKGDFDTALSLYEKAIDGLSKYLGKHDRSICTILSNQAVIHRRRANFDIAEQLILKAIEIQEKAQADQFRSPKLDREDWDWGGALVNLGYLYETIGRYDDAIEQVMIFDKMHEASGIHNPLARAWCDQRLGELYIKTEKYIEGFVHMEKALATNEYIFGKGHPAIAWVLLSLGNGYRNAVDFEMAKKTYEHASTIIQNQFGSNSSQLCIIQIAKANLFIDSGFYGEAESQLLDIIQNTGKGLDNEHQYLVKARELISKLRNLMDKNEKEV